jgi:hypothetical protein
MKSRLLNLLTILSLLLCVAVVALWVRSYWTADVWHYRSYRKAETSVSTRWWAVFSSGDGAGVVHRRSDVSGPPTKIPAIGFKPGLSHDTDLPNLRVWAEVWNDAPTRLEWRWADRQRLFLTRSTGASGLISTSLFQFGLVLPFWLLVILTALIPAWRGLTIVRKVRKKEGLCPCGYDLRATPEKCPECGKSPAGAKA